MRNSQIKLVEWVIHGLIVILALMLLNYPAFDLTFGVFSSGDQSLLWPSISGTILNLVLFYSIALYLIPVILKRRRGALYFVLWLLVIFMIISGIEFAIDYNIYQASGRVYSGDVQIEILLMIVITHILVVMFAFAYRFSKDWFRNEEIRRNISEQQLRSELEVLKGQINPHFLFNALNNLFSMSLHSGDEKTAEGISKLSEMMRYVFDRSGQDSVELKEEIQYISDYIHLQQLRFDKQVQVHFTIDIHAPFSIAPMLLIPFVENAFKYGVSSQEKTEIEINVSADKEVFQFEIENKIVVVEGTTTSNNVGIENVRKRLLLIYPERHELKAEESNGFFNVLLQIKKQDV